MSATLAERPGTGISPPQKPSVWRVGWATFLGYLWTVLLGLPVVLALVYVGLGFNGPEGGGRGVFLHYDVWSWLAEGCVGLLATFITALLVGWQLRERTGWEVPFSFTFLTLLVTGYAPLLTLTPFYEATAPVSLVAATLILRWRCEPSGAEPRKSLAAVPRRYRRGVAIALAVAGPLMFAYVVAYGATHPLQEARLLSLRGGPHTHEHSPGALMRFDLSLYNSGPAAIKDIELVRLEGSPVFQLERVGIEPNTWTVPNGRWDVPPPLRPLDRWDLYGDGDTVTLELRQGRFCPPGIGKLDAVWIRYTVFGGRHEQRLPLADAPRVRCP
jgi:hypothetical protein